MSVRLWLNPATDESFLRTAQEMLRQVDTPEALQAALRLWYPQAAVNARGLSGEVWTTWYVYRYGMWVDDPRGGVLG